MPRKVDRKTETPLEIAELCVDRLVAAIRSTCPGRNADNLLELSLLVMNDKTCPEKARALARALQLALTARDELRDPNWERRRAAAAATDVLLRELEEWMTVVKPLVEYNVEREKSYGPAANVFTMSFLPWLVAFIHGGIFHVSVLADLQLLHPDTRSRGQPPHHVRNDVTRLLNREKLSVSEITAVTERVNDVAARKRVRNRITELSRHRHRRAGQPRE